MYGNRRAATIQSVTTCTLWKLDRDTFKKIVLNAMIPTHSAFHTLIQQVPVFGISHAASMTEEEQDRIVKASQRIQYPKGEEVISYHHLTMDSYVFLIISGDVRIVSPEGKELARLGPHDYFGERVILYEESPQASARTATNIQVYRLPATALLSLPVELLEALRQRAHNTYV